jgi:DNA polymerase-4
MTLERPTSSALDIANAAYDLFSSLYKWNNPVRGVGVSVCNFTQGAEQLLLGVDYEAVNKKDKIDCTIDGIRKKYGNTSLQRARILQDKKLAGADIKGDNFTHDISSNKE